MILLFVVLLVKRLVCLFRNSPANIHLCAISMAAMDVLVFSLFAELKDNYSDGIRVLMEKRN